MDAVLLPFLRAVDAGESDRLLERLVCEHADPGIRQVLRHKLRGVLSESGRSVQPEGGDIEDVYSEARLQLITRLAELKRDSAARPIENFRGYVAAVAYNACHEFLRLKYPRRHRLKNRIRYRLDHHPVFACWEGPGPDRLCGFAAWRGQDRLAPVGPGDEAGLVVDAGHLDDVNLLKAIFERSAGPIELDDLVTLYARLRGISDAAVSVSEVAEPGRSAAADREDDFVEDLARRGYVQRLWAEIRLLLPRQRVALLLNLRDVEGGNALDLFVTTGIASIRRIAEVVEMAPELFARLWNDLPLTDAAIAGRLGVTRQQVINLRKSARERLARRLR